VPGLLPEGVSLLAGKPKKRKSWLALELALAVVHGQPLLGNPAWLCGQGEVLYLALEDGKRRLQGRLNKLTSDEHTALDHLCLQTQWPRLDEGGLDHIARWLDTTPHARLVILDTLARVRPRRSARSSYDEDYQCLGPVGQLALERGVAILFLTHTRKAGAGDVFDTVNATLGLTGAADTLLLLEALGEDDAVLHVSGRDVELQQVRLCWEKGQCRWQLAGKPPPTRLTTTERDVLVALGNQAMTPKDIAVHLGKNEGAMKTLFTRMKQKGLLISQGHGYAAAPQVNLN
jgi:hypothetical protein